STDGGISYTSLGMVNGKGMSADMQTYALSDMQPFAGVAYYRLVQRNKQGDVRFTDVKVVSRQADLVTYYTIYPNPVQGMLNIRLSAASNEQALTEIFDLNGRRMLSRQFNILAGEQTLGMDMSRLGNGTYIFKLTIGGKTNSQLVNKF
ncbi:MAG: T9SS type A sorting domain-containing protein, partial [Chitinophagaceae bacterium]|nr:T9SS type A sorting domain-containing protein [Chitinophagaceae bacterium]